MTGWAGLWIALGLFFGGCAIGEGLIAIANALKNAIADALKNLRR